MKNPEEEDPTRKQPQFLEQTWGCFSGGVLFLRILHLETTKKRIPPGGGSFFQSKFQAARGKKMSDDKGSDDMTSKSKRKRKSDASPVEFCHRSLAGGNIWDSLADLLKTMKLREVGADEEKDVREIGQHLFKNIVKHAISK